MCQDQPAALNNFICKQCAILFLMLNWKLQCLFFGCLYETRPSCCCTLLRMDQGACARQRECLCVNFVWQWCVAVWTAPLVTPLHTHEAPPHCQWCAIAHTGSFLSMVCTLLWSGGASSKICIILQTINDSSFYTCISSVGFCYCQVDCSQERWCLTRLPN